MRHYSLWLDRYARRRTQILDSWSGMSGIFGELRRKIPPDKLFLELREGDMGEERMCFVDGGEGLRELLGVGVYMIRASGLIHSGDGKAGLGELFLRELDMNVIDYDENTKERVELLRDAMEYEVAARSIEEEKPGIIFLDGSLYVKSRRQPIDCPEFEVYRKKFGRLLRLCKKRDVRLVGVSEDSKSRMLSNHLTAEYKVRFPRFMTDSALLRLLADKGAYQSMRFMPESRFETGEDAEDGLVAGFPTAYMQPNELSNPLRIDVPDWERDFDGIVAGLAGLCRGSGTYGYPLQLYLAHLDARIPSSQMDWTVKQLVSYLTKRDEKFSNALLRDTRRSQRPQ